MSLRIKFDPYTMLPETVAYIMDNFQPGFTHSNTGNAEQDNIFTTEDDVPEGFGDILKTCAERFGVAAVQLSSDDGNDVFIVSSPQYIETTL